VLEIGRITRAQGLRGEVLVQLITSERSRLDVGSVLFADDERLVVAGSRPHQRNFVVAFEGVSDRAAADALRGRTLFAEPITDTDDDAFWVHELIGAEVVDADGRSRGRVESVQQNPASDLLVLDSGALVPLTFARGWDVRGERLRVDPPAGLFDL
jgi:16S rRNA processing protein RimM